MSGFSLAFSPLIPWTALAVIGAVAALLALANLAARLRGAVVRAVAIALFVLALANPSISKEDRETLPNVVAVVVDRSASQALGERTGQTDTVRAALDERSNDVYGRSLAHVVGLRLKRKPEHRYRLAAQVAGHPPRI